MPGAWLDSPAMPATERQRTARCRPCTWGSGVCGCRPAPGWTGLAWPTRRPGRNPARRPRGRRGGGPRGASGPGRCRTDAPDPGCDRRGQPAVRHPVRGQPPARADLRCEARGEACLAHLLPEWPEVTETVVSVGGVSARLTADRTLRGPRRTRCARAPLMRSTRPPTAVRHHRPRPSDSGVSGWPWSLCWTRRSGTRAPGTAGTPGERAAGPLAGGTSAAAGAAAGDRRRDPEPRAASRDTGAGSGTGSASSTA